MDRQRAFDDMVEGLRSQGYKRAIGDDGIACRYRSKGKDGTVLKCAVGWLIPDDAYHPVVDTCGLGARALLRDEPNVRAAIEAKYGAVTYHGAITAEDDVRFLAYAQTDLHDYACPSKEDMELRFQVFAGRYKLAYTPPAQD